MDGVRAETAVATYLFKLLSQAVYPGSGGAKLTVVKT